MNGKNETRGRTSFIKQPITNAHFEIEKGFYLIKLTNTKIERSVLLY